MQKTLLLLLLTLLFFGVELIAAAAATVAAVVTVTTTAAAAVVVFLCGKCEVLLLDHVIDSFLHFNLFSPPDRLLPRALLHLLRVSRPLSADGRGGQGAHGAQTGGSHGEKCFFIL